MVNTVIHYLESHTPAYSNVPKYIVDNYKSTSRKQSSIYRLQFAHDVKLDRTQTKEVGTYIGAVHKRRQFKGGGYNKQRTW